MIKKKCNTSQKKYEKLFSGLLKKVGIDDASIQAYKWKSLKIIQHVSEAVADMHKLDLCHGDIKPQNIFLNEKPGEEVEGILADLGCAVKTNSRIKGMTSEYADIETKRKYFFPVSFLKNTIYGLWV